MLYSRLAVSDTRNSTPGLPQATAGDGLQSAVKPAVAAAPLGPHRRAIKADPAIPFKGTVGESFKFYSTLGAVRVLIFSILVVNVYYRFEHRNFSA